MENLKTEFLDEREEGEISLDDVSSSEDTNYNISSKNSKKPNTAKKHIKREVDMLSRDADHGKENRRFSNELVETGPKFNATKQEKNDDLLPISSDEGIEFVGLPGTSKQLAINIGPKKKRKKKKKKKSGPRMLVVSDLVSAFDDEPDVLGVVSDDRRDFIVSRPYRGDVNEKSPSPIRRMNSPPRHPSWHLPKSSPKHYHSPLKHSRSPIRRSLSPHQRSPRKFLSPRKSPAFNSDRRVSHKSPRDYSPNRYSDSYASSLLKKVRHLETVGSITPDNPQKFRESSLKEKLNNMMITNSREIKENVDNWQTDIDDTQNKRKKTDDEEDIESLRRKALETKLHKNNVQSNHTDGIIKSEHTSVGNTNVSDDDEEDLELRMIALRSAVMKKHRDRVQRGIMTKKRGTDIKDESPFSDSFLHSLDSYLDSDSHRITSPINQLSNTENAHVEDMDLDSDVEREKESSQPYSPTDELLEHTITDPIFPDESLIETSNDRFLTSDVDENATNLVTPQYANKFPTYLNHMENVPTLAVPTDQVCATQIESVPQQEPLLASRDPRLRRHINSDMEMSYAPNYTATLHAYPPEIPHTGMFLNSYLNPHLTSSSNLIEVPLANNFGNSPNIPPVPHQPQSTPLLTAANVVNQSYEMQKTNTKESNAIVQNVQTDVTHNDILRDLAEYTSEPLYLQGVPDITKDVNKIPTLVNRTLVPVPILKINKNLQQPLPSKKADSNNEPTFKSAEMLPVNVQSQPAQSGTIFKPIKLQSTTKKNQVMTTPAVVFNKSLNDEIDAESPIERGLKAVGNLSNPSSNKSGEIPVNSQVTGSSQTPVAIKDGLLKHVKPSVRTGSDKIPKKTQQKTGTTGKSTVVSNEIVKNKIIIKRNSKSSNNKESSRKNNAGTSEVKNSDVNNAKKKDIVQKSDTKKGRRSKSAAGSGNKSDENLKNNSGVSKNIDVSKQKKDITKKVSKTKTIMNYESNLKKTNAVNGNASKLSTTKSDDKKRRSSADEDEESLRAALLASLPKRTKSSDSRSATSATKTTLTAQSTKRKSAGVKESSKVNVQSKTTQMLPPISVPSQSINKQRTSSESKSTMSLKTNVATTRKRVTTAPDSGPSKKIAKDNAASSTDPTNILNVAEKMVESEIQRKLAQQQTAIGLLFNKVQQNSKTNAPRSTAKDPTSSPKIVASKNLERMIIRLGEDSDTDSDTDNEMANSKMKNTNSALKEANKAPTIPSTDFEKSLEEFLRSQREKQESSTAISPSVAAKQSTSISAKQTSTITGTPLAVRHLPASKQEEYRRLKQRIAEREQQKMHRTAQTTTKNQTSTTFTSEETPVASTTVYNSVVNQTQSKSATATTDEAPQSVLNPPYRGITLQTQIASSALELLETKMEANNTDNSDVISAPILLPDIPIKADPSLTEMRFNNMGEDKKINVTNNGLNEHLSDLNLTGPMDNLTIRIPNICDDNTPFSRRVIIRNDDMPSEQLSAPEVPSLALRILTTDQLNMKFETPTDINDDKTSNLDKKVTLNEAVQMSDDNTTMPCKIIDNIAGNAIDTSITVETCKIENNVNVMEQPMASYQTATISEIASTILCEQSSSPIKNLPKNELEETIDLNSTISNDIDTNNDSINSTNTLSAEVLMNTEVNLPVLEKVQDFTEKIESCIQVQLEDMLKLSEDQQRIQLTTMEKDLVAKRYVIIDHLTGMTQKLQEWEVQMNLAAEVKRLEIQLQEAKERLRAQCEKTMNISPQVTTTQNTINEKRGECIKLSKLCLGIGSKVMGHAYKLPSIGNQILEEKLHQVENMNNKLSSAIRTSVNSTATQNNDTVITESKPTKICEKNFPSHLPCTDDEIDINEHLTVKNENIDDMSIIMTNMNENSIDEKSVVPATIKTPEIVNTTDEITDSINIGISFDSNNLSLNNQFTENNNEDISAEFNSNWIKVEDEKPPIQPSACYESVLTAMNTPRLNGLSSIAE